MGKKDKKPLSHAPYNFVPLEEVVISRYNSYKELPAHNRIEKDRYSGSIHYTITPETAIFIGGSKGKEFYKNIDGIYAIPGSTIRGLVRSNMRILGFASVGNEIQDAKFMYRAVAGKKPKKQKENQKENLREQYRNILGEKSIEVQAKINGEIQLKSVLVAKNVKAGYLKYENGKYYIYGTIKDARTKEDEINYYVVREEIAIELSQKFRELNDLLREEEKKPFYKEISFKVDGENLITEIGEVENDSKVGKKVGYIMRSGYIKNKKAIYIIPDIGEKLFEIPQKDIDNYNIDWNMKKNILENGEVDYWKLPDTNGEIKPVFYLWENGNLNLGFTPRLRLLYEHSILEGLPKEHLEKEGNTFDYVKSIMGFTDKNQNYRSRVQFFDAVLDTTIDKAKFFKKSLILGEPKPTSYRDYLTNKDGKIATYNDPDFRLRGVKQYWFHQAEPEEKKEEKDTSENVKDEIQPMKKGGVFKGTIQFENLAEDELGLLLWSLRLNEDSRQNLGKGKPYGYGRVKIIIENLKVRDTKLAYQNFEQLILHPEKKVEEVETYIKAYKDYVKNRLIDSYSKDPKKEVEEYPSIRDFLRMKSEKNLLEEYKVNYMSIQKKEYQKREDTLPKIGAVLGSYYKDLSESRNMESNKTGSGYKDKDRRNTRRDKRQDQKKKEDCTTSMNNMFVGLDLSGLPKE